MVKCSPSDFTIERTTFSFTVLLRKGGGLAQQETQKTFRLKTMLEGNLKRQSIQ